MKSASERIAAELRARIESGELRPGELLPSARQITRDWRVAIATATRVHATLREAGLAETLPGVGVVVRTPRPSSRARRSPRTDLLVATAVAVADAEGLEAVSMRRLATELETPTMSLYGRVADKDELLLRMLEVVFAEWRPPHRADAGWRECLEAAARGLWRIFNQHPWLASALSLSRPALIPAAIGWTEWVLQSLASEVPDLTARFDIHLTLFGLVRGIAVDLERESAALTVTGMNADEWMDTQLPRLREITESTGLRNVTELVHHSYDFSLDRIFERGLHYFLDGLAAEID